MKIAKIKPDIRINFEEAGQAVGAVANGVSADAFFKGVTNHSPTGALGIREVKRVFG